MSSMCPYVCDNKTVGGFCRTTFCINPTHSNIGTVQYGQGEQKQIVTNADRFRAKSDEELAKTISGDQIYPWCTEEPCKYDSCTDCVLAWLKQEADT